MKLTYRLAACLVAGNCVVLGLYGYLAHGREVAAFEHAMERDTYGAGATLLAVVEATWREEGDRAARRLIARASAQRPGMDFTWHEALGVVRPALDPAQVEDLRAGRRALARRAGALHTFVPFTPPGASEPGVLEVTKSLAADATYVGASVRRLGVATGVSVLVSAALAMLLGSVVVGRPVDALVAKVERIGAGDLSGRLALERADELGRLGEALDGMAADLAEARRRAEAEAAERLATLRQLRHAERLATVGRLASGVAHEVGTPLNVVSARAKMIERGTGEEALRRHAEVIREQADRMTRVIRQLLDFARPRESRRAPTDLARLAAGVVEVLGPLAAKRGVALELDEPPPAGAPARADADQLEQVLTNLVMNAVQASPPGAAVTVAVAPARAQPPAEPGAAERDCWRVSVRDAGPGIPPEVRARIFEPFFTTKDVGEGTGLGLPVAHGIVAEHDGWIEVESQAGAGTELSVLLPRGGAA